MANKRSRHGPLKPFAFFYLGVFMSDILCPHCGASNALGSSFCESCGKALPSGANAGPRVVSKGEFATNRAGQSLQAKELKKQMKSARGGLLAVAIIQIVGGLLLYFVLSSMADEPRSMIDKDMVNILPVITGVIAAIYFGLWAWAKSSPFPAALTGLILYATLWFGEVLYDPSAILNGILIKIIIIVVLVKAVQAGLAYRKLVAQADGRLG